NGAGWPISDLPVKGMSISQKFYEYNSNKGGRHLAVDIRSSGDRAIRAPLEGVVKYCGNYGANGWHVFLEHEISGKKYYTLYSHMAGNPGLSVNQKIARGGRIGTMGSSGTVVVHLHFSVMDTYYVGPYGYISSAVKSGGKVISESSSKVVLELPRHGKVTYYNPGEILGKLAPGSGGDTDGPGFSYPNNAAIDGDFFNVRDENGNPIEGRRVDNGDSITVIDVSLSKKMLYVEYPTASGVRKGWITNVPSIIKYKYAGMYHNGSTPEPVLDENGAKIGSLDPNEAATPLYRKNGKLHIVYNTREGVNTKSGYVKYDGGFTKF
ncbi:MAG: M23 family metallopeptidase, partial [Oligoflexales bacterium]|nr:M23 family metallopeptidase [Oligoflexales bacterium]